MQSEHSSKRTWKTINGVSRKIGGRAGAVQDAIDNRAFGFDHFAGSISGLPGPVAGVYKSLLHNSFPSKISVRKAL